MKHSPWQLRVASLGVSVLLALGASAAKAAVPSAITNGATAITQSGATLTGTVSANGDSTTVTFEWGLSSLYGSSAAATQSPLPGSASGTAVSLPIGGLSCNTLYHFRVTANNISGFSGSGDSTFTTSACPAGAPTATTNAATAITQTTGTLNGTVAANGTTTTVGFLYGLTTLYGIGIAANQNPLPGSASGAAVDQTITGLQCNTLYHFNAFANNGIGGVQFGGDLTFTTSACTAGAPGATTTAAASITQTGATLNGTVTANGASTTVTFEWGLSSLYGNSAAATQSPLAGSASGAAVSVPITGLQCNTLYHFHVTANNGTGGTIDGGDLTFTTSACTAGAPSAIPALSDAALLCLSVLLAAFGFAMLRAPRL